MSGETLRGVASLSISDEINKRRLDQFAGWEWVRIYEEPQIFEGASLRGKIIKTGFLGYFYQKKPGNNQEITELLQTMGDAGFKKMNEWEKLYEISEYGNRSKIKHFLLGKLTIDKLTITELRDLSILFGGWIAQLRATAMTNHPEEYFAFYNDTRNNVKHSKTPPDPMMRLRPIDTLLTANQKIGITVMMNVGLVGHPDIRERIDKDDSRIFGNHTK